MSGITAVDVLNRMVTMHRFIMPLGLALVLGCSKRETGETAPSPADAMHTYATDFPGTEFPISDGGRWVNGGTAGRDWTDVSTTPHRAIGHQTGDSYTDATALLDGAWWADERVTATVFTAGVVPGNCSPEVELRLRSKISQHNNRGYEVSFKVSDTDDAYLIIVRWNGKLGDFTYLFREQGAQYGVKNGDVVSATVVGNRITAFKNGVEMGHGSDGTYAAGSPGIGFNLENRDSNCVGTNDRYGFSAFSVADATQ